MLENPEVNKGERSYSCPVSIVNPNVFSGLLSIPQYREFLPLFCPISVPFLGPDSPPLRPSLLSRITEERG